MDQEPVLKTIIELGLTPMDAQVYLFLAKKGTQKGSEMLKTLKMNRQQLYRSLKNLQGKGIANSTLERPARFSAVSFEKVIDMFIKVKIDEAQQLQQHKDELLALLQSVQVGEQIDASARFMVIEGTKNTYLKVLQMINETQNQLSTMTTVQGLMQASRWGLFDAGFAHPLKSQIHFRFLTHVSAQNVDLMKALLKTKSDSQLCIEGRCIDSGLKLIPRVVMRDEEEILFFISSKADMSSLEREDTGFWTNSKALVHAFRAMFEEYWLNSTAVEEKIVEIEMGKSVPETRIIRDAETAHKKYLELIGAAKEEIVKMTSEKGLARFWMNSSHLERWNKSGVSVRIMAPITSENLRVAQQLSKYCKVRHVSPNYPRTTIIDGKYLFLFKTPPPEKETTDSMIYFENAFFTNDFEYINNIRDMLNNIWNSACDISEVTVESVVRFPVPTIRPSDSVLTTAKIMANADAGAVVVAENRSAVGIITEKDILNRVINARKDPSKTLVKEVMSSPVITVDHKQIVKDALELMQKHKIRRLVVVKGEKIAGLITERRALKSCSIRP